MRKWIKRIFLTMGALLALLFLGVFLGGHWAADRYLAREYAVGPGRVRLVAPDFRWSLDLQADSAIYASPDLGASVRGLRVSVDLFRSLLHFAPSARLEMDTVLVRMGPGPDTVKPRMDSIPFPDFKFPAAAVVRIGRVTVRDTAADSLAPLLQADGIAADTRGERGVSLLIGAAQARALGPLIQSLKASADWSDTDAVQVRAAWRREGDTAAADLQLAKPNLLRLKGMLRAHVASTSPYARALRLDAGLPRAEAFDLEVHASHARGYRGDVKADFKAAGLPGNLPIRLPDQKLAVRFAFVDSSGTWSLAGKGAGGEEIDLHGSLKAQGDSLDNPAWLARHAQVTAAGRVRGFQVTAGGKRLPADLQIASLQASPTAVRAEAVTGDGSRLKADVRLDTAAARRATAARSGRKGNQGNSKATVTGLPPWNGSFSLDLAPRETWILAFTDTNVAFTKAAVRGALRGGEARADMEIRGLKAYGLMADSLVAIHRYGPGGYVLEPSRLWWRGVDWELSGTADPRKPGPPASVRIANAEFGSVEAGLKDGGRLEARIRGLAPEMLPYRGLDGLKANHPRVSADFTWDRAGKKGSASVDLEGRYQKESVKVSAAAEWDAEVLRLQRLKASLSGNEITASAKVRLHGRQFYALQGLAPADVEDASLGADHFDLAKALTAIMPEPPISAGVAVGNLGYSPAEGFRGEWRLQDVKLADGEARFAIKELAIAGRGDSVVIRAVTVSDVEPLFRDSVTVGLTGILGRSQTLIVRGRAGEGIFLGFDGNLKDFKDLDGRFSLRGDAALPSGSGVLRELRVTATVAMPLKEGIKGLRLEADTLRGIYAVPGLDTQSFAATVRMRGGKVEVPNLSVSGKAGSGLQGHAQFDPASRRLVADLAGGRFSAQMGGDKVQLRELAVHVQADSTQLTVQAAVGSGSAEHVKSPLRAAGDFTRLTAFYRAPLKVGGGGREGAGTPYLRLNVTLDSSTVRYRVRSLESITGIFRKEGQRKAAGRRVKPIQVQINLETAGRGNSIETDVLRVSYVGNVSMVGTYPYALMRGRINSSSGGLGTKKQSYDIKGMEIKWLNAPLEEGELDLHAEKRLARTCDTVSSDSCSIRMSLTGQLSDIRFAYDSDCRGGYGSGSADVSALIYSVRRGCYSPASSSGAGGLTKQEQALGLLEPLASNYLSQAAEKLSGKWIASAQVSGLGALAQDRERKASDSASTRDAIGLEILSKEFWRLRLRAKSAYNLQYADETTPWSYRVGVEWQPPLFRLVDDPSWRNRIKNRITVDASVFTDPSHGSQDNAEDPLRRRLGLNYNYDWWGHWWAKETGVPPTAVTPTAAGKTAAAPDTSR